MKRCPECGREYDNTMMFCLDDGAELLYGPAKSEAVATGFSESPDETLTAIIDPPGSLGTGTVTEADTKVFETASSFSKQVGRHKFAAITAVAVTAVVLAGFGYGIYKFLNGGQQSQAPARSVNIVTQRLTGDGKARGAEISPDGKFLAYIRTDGGERSIWIKQIQTNSNIQILKPGELDLFDGMVFSPDGNFLYFNAESASVDEPSVYRLPTLGGTPTKVLSNARDVQFSPSGLEVSFGRYDLATNVSSVVIANTDGANERTIASTSGTGFLDGPPAWSPDGKTIAVPSGDDTRIPDPIGAITIITVTDGAARELGEAWHEIGNLVWHPSGDSLIVAGNDGPLGQPQIWEVAYPSGTRRRLTNNLNGHFSVSITADGSSIVTGEIFSRSAVWVSPDLKPENAVQVMPDTGDTWGISWTHDNKIVYVSNQTGDAEVWVMDADGANAKPLTNDRQFKMTPVASPDGRYIVYTSSSGGGQLVRIDANGGNPTVLVSASGADNPDISLDSKWVIYSAYSADGILRVHRVPIEGGESQRLTEYRATEPRYSRDGTRFACFTPNEKTQNWTRLAIVPAEGGAPLTIFDSPPNTNITRGPIWTPDDSGITLVVAPGEMQNLWLQPVDGSPGKMMTNFQLPGIARREYSRDGKRIAIVRAQGIGNAIMITDFR